MWSRTAVSGEAFPKDLVIGTVTRANRWAKQGVFCLSGKRYY
jgi:hypothetical protein